MTLPAAVPNRFVSKRKRESQTPPQAYDLPCAVRRWPAQVIDTMPSKPSCQMCLNATSAGASIGDAILGGRPSGPEKWSERGNGKRLILLVSPAGIEPATY